MSNPTYTKAIELLNLARVAPYTEARELVKKAADVLDASERALLALRRMADGLRYGADMATSLVVCVEDAISLLTSKKAIEWSYPSSTNAARFGFAKTGCWTVTVRDGLTSKAIAGFATPAEAVAVAKATPGVWCPMFIRFASEAVRAELGEVL